MVVQNNIAYHIILNFALISQIENEAMNIVTYILGKFVRLFIIQKKKNEIFLHRNFSDYQIIFNLFSILNFR